MYINHDREAHWIIIPRPRKGEMSRMQKFLLAAGMAVILISDIVAATMGSVEWLFWGTLAGVVVCGLSYHLSTRHVIR